MPSVILDPATLLDLELEGNALIEASAGTGKTHTIADLYLRHILDGRQPAQILVVTFTIAATEELRGRIRNRLYQTQACLQQRSAPADKFLEGLQARHAGFDQDQHKAWLHRLQLALRSMDEAAISTIHGFCQRSLQDFALAGGQYFDAELLSDDAALWEDAVRDWWRRQVYALDPEAWKLLSVELPSLPGIVRTVLELRNKSDLRLLPGARCDARSLTDEMREIAGSLHQLAPRWTQAREEIADILRTSKALSRARLKNKIDSPYKLSGLDDFLLTADRFFATPNPPLPFRNFQYLAASWLDRLSTDNKRGTDPRLSHPLFEALDPIAQSWAELYQRIRPSLVTDAFLFAAERVRSDKRDLPALAFQDQLTNLRDALEAPTGAALAKRIRARYPVAMIDEFQDTDATQYRIFQCVYAAAADCSLTLIGDPKQAIYSFRGSDIFTYMQARRLPGQRRYSLRTNWRSHTGLVDAVNSLFTHRDHAFVYSDSIAFEPAQAIRDNDGLRLYRQGDPVAALTLWQLPQDADGKNYGRNPMRDLINRAIVGEIANLLGLGDAPAATFGERALQSGDIAVLVRSGAEGIALSRLMHAHGIRTITIGRDSVFSSDEASGLYELLRAIERYPDPQQLRRSLTSSLLDLDYRQIAQLTEHEERWQDWLDELAALHDIWQRQGFITMFQTLLYRFDICQRLARRDNSERRLTDLLHLAELLHQQSVRGAGIAPLLAWFVEQFDEDNNEEAELRLENDEALVKIVTIHSAKGLQYPVVFVPFLWSCRQAGRDHTVFFHDAELRSCVDLGSDEIEQHRRLADKERLAEDLRLLYVALTRARSKVYLAWGDAGSKSYTGHARQTALAWLLHSHQTPQDLERTGVDGFPSDFNLERDLDSLVERGDGSIERVMLPDNAPAPGGLAADRVEATPRVARFRRSDLGGWRINSFTGLTRGVHQPAQTGLARGDGDPILEFPAGSHIGLLLHSLLEHLDFEVDIAAQCERLLPRFLPGSGITQEAQQRTLIDWLEYIVQTPLADDGPRLRQIARTQRLNELNFDFALDRLSIGALNEYLQSLAEVPLQPVSSADFSGLVNGVIDLVFEYDGRYYLADYKSNFLGASLQDYAAPCLERAMYERRYDLQSLLYSVALHRYLGQRVAAYDYATHFGGSYYLFLRALRPDQGHRYGVHFSRPERATLETLEAFFGFTLTDEAGA